MKRHYLFGTIILMMAAGFAIGCASAPQRVGYLSDSCPLSHSADGLSSTPPPGGGYGGTPLPR